MAMTHHVPFPDDVYQIAEREAKRRGLSPEEWIVATVSRAGAPVPADEAPEGRSVSEVLSGLVGAFDSSQEEYRDRQRSPMAEMVADKLQRQGIEVPWRRQR